MHGLVRLCITVICVSSAVRCLPTSSYEGDRLLVFVPTRTEQLEWLQSIAAQAGKEGEIGETIRFWIGPEVLNKDTIVYVPAAVYDSFVAAIPDFGARWWLVQQENMGRLVAREAQANLERSDRLDISSAYQTYDKIMDFLQGTATSCGSYCQVEQFGSSFEKRKLLLFKIGDTATSRRIVWIDAGIHAREWIAPATALYLIDKIVTGYKSSDSAITAMLRSYAFYIAPLLNPDGYAYTFTGDRFWRKTRSPQANGCYGVDGNRNFGYYWGPQGTSTNPCSDTFRGTAPFTEPETRAVRDKLLSIRSRTVSYITMHSYGQYWMVPYGYDYNVPVPNAAQMMVPVAAAASKLASLNRPYQTGNSATVTYPAAGASDDWAASIGVPYAHTIELPDTGQYGFNLPPSQIPRVGLEILEAFKVYISKVAAAMPPRDGGEESK